MHNFNPNYAVGLGAPMWIHVFGPLLLLLVLWSVLWKGLALWHAGRRGLGWWFVALLILNTAGILEIIFLFGVLKLKFSHLFAK